MPIEQIAFDVPFLAQANIIYGVPSQTKWLTWYAPNPADLYTSVDGTVFVKIDSTTGGSQANNVAVCGTLIKATANAYLIARGRF